MSDEAYINDIVVTTRVRLARNITDIPYPIKTTDESALLAVNKAVAATELNPELADDHFGFTSINTLNELNRRSMVERHLISPELGKYKQSGVIINADSTISIMVNEEDHIRIQCILKGLKLLEAYEMVNRIDDAMQEVIPFSYSDKYGFLTSCPSNLGTGMRAGVMVHIPALTISNRLPQIAGMANRFGLAIRGMYGEGSEALGDLFQISNQHSLGITEEEIVNSIHSISREIIKLEREERNSLLINQEDELKDRIYRAYGILTNACVISTRESMSLLSLMRMGVDLGLFVDITDAKLDDLIIKIQPATLALSYNENADDRSLNIYRASFIQQELLN
ncbi:MAG: protein arginine kinase [Eubacteriaceae bacterium]|nr:protein arginine kinase [Eubacteriaceae bacterium]